MMDVRLTTWMLFDHAEFHLADVPIVTVLPDGGVHRYTYREMAARTQQLMHALDGLGVPAGAPVATLAWNSYRHLEAYLAVPCSGRVVHTLNLRLSPEEIGFIVDDAADQVIIVDADLVPLLVAARHAGGLGSVRHVIVMSDQVPDVDLPGLLAYERLISNLPTHYAAPGIDEGAVAGICYTSGTTGRPKGVEYTHRSLVLHAFAVATGAGMSIGPEDCVLPVVPMFHANAWGVPHAATMVGAKQVFLAGPIRPEALVGAIVAEEVTVTAGVPTIWIEAAAEFRRLGGPPPALRHIACGGAQPSKALIRRYRDELGIRIVQAWGLTETSPIASLAWPKHHLRHEDPDTLLEEVGSQAGLPVPGIDVTIRDYESDDDLPWDGVQMGRLLVRGPWVVDAYRHRRGADQFQDGWFATGDVAVGSPNGYFRISDRTKDLIKSGGEWISSVDMEAALMAMPEVSEAAVIGVPDAKWQERPLACLVPVAGASPTLQDVHARLTEAGFAHWQLPDRVELLDAVPRTSVGKFDKKVLRARFAPDD